MVEKSSNNAEIQPESHRHTDIDIIEAATFRWRINTRASTWRPPTDVYETEDGFHVRVEIAGMREEGFSIELIGRLLTIRGIRQDTPERRAYHQMEIRFGEFNLELELPNPIEADLVQATYNNGFLRIFLPKAQPKQIPIKE